MKKSILLSIGVIFSSLCLAQSKLNANISPYRFKNFTKIMMMKLLKQHRIAIGKEHL